jgi:ribosomal protein L11 methyltransferase
MDWPALDVASSDSGLVLASADDFSPTALEERGSSVRLFFSTGAARDAARAALASVFAVDPIDVPDEDWARRSQQNLPPVVVGRITVVSGVVETVDGRGAASGGDSSLTIVIPPSMGFGTGHHATTRLCLAALQAINIDGAFALDVGTGSGLLAIAAARLGAINALGIDCDADAIQSARESLAQNPDVPLVTFEVADLTSTPLPKADVVTANLTGALLVRSASTLRAALRPGGTLILSGLQSHERAEVVQAFDPLDVRWEAEEDGWVAVALSNRSAPSPV